jgi:elongation factor P hydroxylase
MNGARQNELDRMSVKRLVKRLVVNYLDQTVSERIKRGIHRR